MCSYVTEKIGMRGSGKGTMGWFQLSHACVYFDHPYFTPLEHTVNIDFISEGAGPEARVAVELSPDSARALVKCIEAAFKQMTPAAEAGTSLHDRRAGRF
ncbi:MAG: DUF6295 family protein [Candidatus Dormibacteraceae bacterium]